MSDNLLDIVVMRGSNINNQLSWIKVNKPGYVNPVTGELLNFCYYCITDVQDNTMITNLKEVQEKDRESFLEHMKFIKSFENMEAYYKYRFETELIRQRKFRDKN